MTSEFTKEGKEKIAVIGLGYVGLPLALLVDSKGYEVIGVDINEEKVKALNNRQLPIATENEIVKQLKASNLKATSDYKHIRDVSIIAICVPTPVHENNMPNLEPLEKACNKLAQNLQKGQLVILESTVNPGVSEGIVLPILEDVSGLKGGVDFYLAHCPERINPGDTRWTVANIPRVVGSLEETGLQKALAFYGSIVSAEIKPMNSLKEAEAVKIVENTFRDVNIAFVNELAMSFSHLGIDVINVIEGAATKPFAFMPHFPGCGVGGHCIPVDPYYLIEYAKNIGFNHDFLKLARRINEEMPQFTVQLLARALNENKMAINGTRIAILGLSYKPEIDDCRESPSYKIMHYLREYNADVIIYDPFVPERSNVNSLEEALQNTPAAIIATAHRMFTDLTPDDFLEYGTKVIVDGRNCLPKEDFIKAGIIYKGIGR